MPRRKITKIKTLGRDSGGRYFRNLGWVLNSATGKYSQRKFYLGHDEDDAKYTNSRLEALWSCIERAHSREQLFQLGTDKSNFSTADLAVSGNVLSLKTEHLREPERPVWSPLTLEIADAIRQGKPIATISSGNVSGRSPTSRCDLQAWLFRIRQDYDVIHIEMEDKHLNQQIDRRLTAEGEALRKKSDLLLRLPKSNQTLHQAIEQYVLHVQRETVDENGEPTEWAKAKTRQIAFIKRHTKDIDLLLMAEPSIESILVNLRQRPFTSRGGHCTKRHAQNCIKELRVFLKWLAENQRYDWSWPPGYELKRGKINEAPEQAGRRSLRLVEHYGVDELTVLYRYATPVQRLYLLLGLNCGFINAELASLNLDEIFLDSCVHPDADVLELDRKFERPWIVRLRGKTSVYGTWNLWPETVAGIRWWLVERDRIRSEFLAGKRGPERSRKEAVFDQTTCGRLLITKNAKPVAGVKRTGRIPAAWDSLVSRVVANEPDFRELSIKHLRKSGATLVRRVSGGEISSTYLAHGKPFGRDKDLEVYANRPYEKLFAAIDEVHGVLEPLWEAVHHPFSEKRKLGGKANVLPRQRKQILDLKKQGVRAVNISNDVGLHVSTVYRVLRRED